MATDAPEIQITVINLRQNLDCSQISLIRYNPEQSKPPICDSAPASRTLQHPHYIKTKIVLHSEKKMRERKWKTLKSHLAPLHKIRFKDY